MAKDKTEQMIETLEKILKVVSIGVTEGKSITEGIVLLKSAGLDNKTIAVLLGTTDKTVQVTASQAKKLKKSRFKLK